MARKIYSADFETTTKVDDCRVWAYGWMQVGNKQNYNIGNSIDDFMLFLVKCQGNVYFHNLRFDGEFIVNWLLKHGWKHEDSGLPNTFTATISAMGQWYKIDICSGYKYYKNSRKKIHTVIYDSLKKLPFKVKDIAKDFGLEIRKGEIDYHKERPVGYVINKKERGYIKNDIEIIADALKIQFDQGLTGMTNGRDSLDGFIASISKKMFEKLFPVYSFELNEKIRKAYRGGFTWMNAKYKDRIVNEGLVYDVNSLYPAMMYTKPLPYGMPIYFDGEYKQDDTYNLYIQHLRCEFYLRENHIPTIQIKKKLAFFMPNEYLEHSKGEIVDLYVSNVDLDLIKEHYNLYNVDYVGGWKFKSKTGMFNQFIDKWTYVKTHETGAKKLLAKLMLNSLYGKFATNPDVTGKVPFLKEDGSCGFRSGEDNFRDPIYTPLGVFITSWARDLTIRTAQSCYDRIVYCDTDSIHLEGLEVPKAISHMIDDKKLGYWAHESTLHRGKYIRQKTYCYEVIEDKPKYVKRNGKWVMTNWSFQVKCAGMPDKVKDKVTWDNFKVGFSSYGKLLPKHVSGGVVLVDSEFTLKG